MTSEGDITNTNAAIVKSDVKKKKQLKGKKNSKKNEKMLFELTPSNALGH